MVGSPQITSPSKEITSPSKEKGPIIFTFFSIQKEKKKIMFFLSVSSVKHFIFNEKHGSCKIKKC